MHANTNTPYRCESSEAYDTGLPRKKLSQSALKCIQDTVKLVPSLALQNLACLDFTISYLGKFTHPCTNTHVLPVFFTSLTQIPHTIDVSWFQLDMTIMIHDGQVRPGVEHCFHMRSGSKISRVLSRCRMSHLKDAVVVLSVL